ERAGVEVPPAGHRPPERCDAPGSAHPHRSLPERGPYRVGAHPPRGGRARGAPVPDGRDGARPGTTGGGAVHRHDVPPPRAGVPPVGGVMKFVPGGPPRMRHQKRGLAKMISTRGVAGLLYEPGTGKGHPLDEPVLTPGGWRAVGDLEVGDEVIGSQGYPVKVTGVFDRGTLPVYRVTFHDGAQVRVDGDHLWRVHYGRGRARTV